MAAGGGARTRLLVALVLIGVTSLSAPRSAALSFEGQEARLARELREGVTPQRVTAASELATLLPRAAWPLIQLGLADPEIEVRRQSAAAAEQLGLVEALELTRPWLESDDPEQREIAVQLEGALGDAASVAALSRALGDARFAVRSRAAEALGRLGLEACATPLGTALEDTDASVRMVAASALGHTPGDEAARLLLARSLDPVLEVRVRVVEALAERGADVRGLDGRVGAVLIAALADDAVEVRVAAILGLARARHAPAAPLLARIVDDASLAVRARDGEREVAAAVAALGRIDATVARAALVRAIARDVAPAPVLHAIEAQLELAPEAMERELTQALTTPEVASSAVAANRIVQAMVQLETLDGGDDALRGILSAVEGGSLPAVIALPALGALMPRTTGAASRPTAATESAVVALLAGLVDERLVDRAIEGLERAAARGVLDPRSVEVLILPEVLDPSLAHSVAPSPDDEEACARFVDADERAARVLSLLGRLDDARALPTLLVIARGREGSPRRAALVALARSSHLDREALVPLLADVVVHLASDVTEERLAMRSIAMQYADDGAVERILAALDAAGSIDRSGALEVVVARLPQLGPALRGRAEAVLVDALASTDRTLSASAAAALVLAAPRVDLLSAASERVRHDSARGDRLALARAVHALGCDTDSCRAVADDAESALDPLERGVEARTLLEPELHFPASSVRSFAVLTAVRRGAIGADAAPALCEMATRREPTVRANAGLALAWLGVACDGVDPTRWLSRGQSVSVQLAGAHWCAGLERAAQRDASPASGWRCDMRRLALAVTRCLDTASDPSLVRACTDLRAGSLDAPVPTRGATLDVTVVASSRPVARRLVTVAFGDGASLIVPTDESGRIVLRLDRVPARDDDGPSVVIQDPYATVLER